MRITISLFLFSLCLIAFAQRQTFNDPDLSWSFKKPAKWQVFDNGLEVKASPSEADTATQFATFTYFENARPFGLQPQPQVVTSSNLGSIANHVVEIGKYKCQVTDRQSSSKNDRSMTRIYRFTEAGQKWKITVVSPTAAFRKCDRKVQKMIKSLKIERN